MCLCKCIYVYIHIYVCVSSFPFSFPFHYFRHTHIHLPWIVHTYRMGPYTLQFSATAIIHCSVHDNTVLVSFYRVPNIIHTYTLLPTSFSQLFHRRFLKLFICSIFRTSGYGFFFSKNKKTVANAVYFVKMYVSNAFFVLWNCVRLTKFDDFLIQKVARFFIF